jgi:gamma-glutamylcyclotransferase (GGCT)/AIG2-like uncharacterized protein YtfP
MRSASLTRRALLGLLPGLALVGWADRARAQSITPQNAARYFRIETQTGTDRGGRPAVWGYVYLNSSGMGGARVRLLVETFDAAGQSIAQEIVYVDSDVPFDGRAYFWVRPKTPGASYRVTIHSGDWTRTGGGAGS